MPDVDPGDVRIILNADTIEYSMDAGANCKEDTKQAVIEALWGKIRTVNEDNKQSEETKKSRESTNEAIE